MGHPRVNNYRSGKNPHQQVVVAELTEEEGGGYSIGVLDTKNGRLVTARLGANETEENDGRSI